MKTYKPTSALFLVLLLLFCACEHIVIPERFENTPVHNFNHFSSDFRNLYGAFDAKGIDWDSLTQVYSEAVTDDMSSLELYTVLTEMLDILNDGHATLQSPEHGFFRSWNRRDKPYFTHRDGRDMDDVSTLRNVIKTAYLNNDLESGTYSGWEFFYGTIDHNEKNIGYLCVPSFNLYNFPNAFIQEAVDAFRECDAVIIDLRFNGGGTTEAFVSLQNRFASEEKLYMRSRFRNGTDPDDFTLVAEHWIKPHATALPAKPIAILSNAYTASSSDHFVVAMKTQPDVICVGDTTFGAFSSVLERILPNGWNYRLGAQVVYGPDGEYLQDAQGNYLEGIGIAPDFFVADDWDMITQNRDAVLEKALFELSK